MYAKFGYAALIRFRVIVENPQGGGGGGKWSPIRAKVNQTHFYLENVILFLYS